MINIEEHINNENWEAALELLEADKELKDIHFGYVFLLRVNYLLDNDNDKRKFVEDFIDHCIELGFEPENVFQAASVSDHHLIKQLLDDGHDINETEYRGLTGLHIAVIQKDKTLVEFLMTLDADNYCEDFENNQPIDYAIEGSEIYNILKQSGVSTKKEIEESLEGYYSGVDFSNDFRATQMEFMEGAELGDISKMEAALSRPKGVWILNGKWPVDGKTALHLATENNKIDAVKFLLKKGLDMNKADLRGETSFDIAKRLELTEILKIMTSENN